MRGYRTLAVNLLAIAAIWFGVDAETAKAWANEIVTGIAAANIALRFVTAGPIAGGKVDAALTALKNWIDRGSFVGVLFAALLLPLALGACAQDKAGLTEVDVKFCPGPDGKPVFCGARVVNGKENRDVHLNVEFPGGVKVEYSVGEALAIRSQEIRAKVHQAVTETAGKTIPEIAAAVVRAVLGVEGIGALQGAASGAVAADAALEAARIKAAAAAVKP